MTRIKPKSNADRRRSAEAQSTRQIARNAVRGGPKDSGKNKRAGAGRGQKG